MSLRSIMSANPGLDRAGTRPEPPDSEPSARREAPTFEAGAPLTQAGFEAGRALLSLDSAALWAVMRVEARACGFLPDRRPVVLFERHVFHRRTQGRHSAPHPSVSNAKPGGYGAPGGHQYTRLAAATALDRVAALESASWGLGQVMGFNARAAGFADIEAMVAAMCASEDAQLAGMCGFIATHGLERRLRARDWAAFARAYNGPGYARNAYDTKLAAAFAELSSGARPPPDLVVRAAQMHLVYAGHDPGPVDGLWGRRTRAAWSAFRAARGDVSPTVADGRPTRADVRILAEAGRPRAWS